MRAGAGLRGDDDQGLGGVDTGEVDIVESLGGPVQKHGEICKAALQGPHGACPQPILLQDAPLAILRHAHHVPHNTGRQVSWEGRVCIITSYIVRHPYEASQGCRIAGVECVGWKNRRDGVGW